LGFQSKMTRPKRSLGQNFFINEHLGEKIVEEIVKSNPSSITEIGPGLGFFTGKLHKKIKDISCIEKDDKFTEMLSGQYPLITLYNEDFLDFDMSKLKKDTTFFGSLPYNASKPIIRKILTSEYFTKPCFFIIQKEVADKYTQKEPRNNLLSLTSQIYSESKKLFYINSGAFRPKPNVESAFIQFVPKKTTVPKDFEKFLIQCFKSPRKTLKNNLRTKTSDPLLLKRPAEISLEEYLILFKKNLI
jgi:16S rRNA (adenine1518-N6/adenine1519-N6)-dimethyltransferase